MRDLLRECPDLADVAEIRHLNGQESITFPGGGSIHFRSILASARGMCLDRCYVPIGTAADVVADILPALMTSEDGTLTGY